jgi:hypothetical protein
VVPKVEFEVSLIKETLLKMDYCMHFNVALTKTKLTTQGGKNQAKILFFK